MGEALKKEEESLRRLFILVKNHTGVTMDDRKRLLLAGRLRPRLRALGLETLEEYIGHLESDGEEVRKFVSLVTTHETQFFRTPGIWAYLKNDFLPKWTGTAPLKVWSAASSTGEEAYSLAMTFEDFKLKRPSFSYLIHGSDISEDVVESARSGIFKERTVENLRERDPLLTAKYFEPVGEGRFKAASHLGARLEFFVHNLQLKAPKSEFYDLVLLRNVLIYFSAEDQELVLRRLFQAMKPGAILILGESESLTRLSVPFQFEKPLIYRRNP